MPSPQPPLLLTPAQLRRLSPHFPLSDLLPILGPPWRASSSAIRTAWAVCR